jgi:hypothetical protein
VIARADPRRLAKIVRLSSEQSCQAVRQDCSFAKKQGSPPARLVVVQSEHLVAACSGARSWRVARVVPLSCSDQARLVNRPQTCAGAGHARAEGDALRFR